MSSGAFECEQHHLAKPAIPVGNPLVEPRSPTLVLSYPHLRPSLEPRRLRREEIWAVPRRLGASSVAGPSRRSTSRRSPGERYSCRSTV